MVLALYHQTINHIPCTKRYALLSNWVVLDNIALHVTRELLFIADPDTVRYT